MEHLLPSLSLFRTSGAHQMLWAGSLQDKRQLAECGFRGHGPSPGEALPIRKDSFWLGIVCGRCVNICVEHVARIQFNISKLHNWARYIAIWYKLAMSFSPPTLCLLAGPVVKGRQRSGKGHCQLQLLYSRKSNRLPTADHSRSGIWRTPPVATKEISGTAKYCKPGSVYIQPHKFERVPQDWDVHWWLVKATALSTRWLKRLEKDEDKKRKVGCPVVCFHWIAEAASFLQQSLAHFICKLECPPGSACSSVSSKSCTRYCLRFMSKLSGWVDESSGHESALTATTNA